ncbi:MAG: magnesium/cobalt transporter CorA, partial [Planctomycetota bacterium]|nr:magnesium/cobalt transporter CorA [Planctomycetota bacterium]
MPDEFEDDSPSLVYHPFRRRSAPGASPGTVIVDPEGSRPQIHVMCYGPDSFYEQTLTRVSEIDEHIGKEPVTWIHIDGLGDIEILQQLAERFGIHPLALEDVVNVHQRAKVDEYSNHLFIVGRMVTLESELRSEQVSIFLGPNYVLTFIEDPGDCFDPLRDRLKKGHGRHRQTGPDYLVYCLLDAIIDAYFPVLEEYGNRLDDLENQEIQTRNASLISVIHSFRRELLFLRKSIWPCRETIGLLLRDFPRQFQDETRVYLRDCYDHTVQIIEVAEMYRDMCSDLRDFLFTMISTRTNEIMKVLTIMSTIFIPLTFIVGVYGMNF